MWVKLHHAQMNISKPCPCVKYSTHKTQELYTFSIVFCILEWKQTQYLTENYWKYWFRILRAITTRWIWLVPSTICITFASRIYRSTLYSLV